MQHIHQLNDKTIDLSPDIPRRWRAFDNVIQQEKSQRKLIITEWGWNHPNQEYALKTFTRGLRSREILQAFVDHPDFDPSFHWSKMINNNSKNTVDPNLECIVLMDIETCFESHYPHYTGTFAANENNISNADDRGGRLIDHKQNRHCYRIFPGCTDNVNKVLESPLFRQAPRSKLPYIWIALEVGQPKNIEEKNSSPINFLFSSWRLPTTSSSWRVTWGFRTEVFIPHS